MDWTELRLSASHILRELTLLPALILGSFRSDLKRIVNDVVTIHGNGNATAKAYRYPILKRVVLALTARPIRTVLVVLLLYSAMISLGEARRLSLPDLDKATVDDIAALNIGLLGVQGALIGLVFPLVIAFVGLLNQGRASFASRLTIYIESTVAVFTGISSLLLCLVIATQLPFASRLEPSAVAAAAGLNLIWFVVNVAALGYFVLRTIAYMHPARRTPLLRAYVANVVWPRELRAIVTRNQWDGADVYGHLPQGDEAPDILDSGHGSRTWYSGLVDFGEPRVVVQLWRKKRLVNVRFAILAPVVRKWLADVRPHVGDAQHDFVVVVEPGQDYEGDQPLVRATTKLGLISTFSTWCAFSFRTAHEDHGALEASADLLKELIADVIALIDTRQVEEFSAQLREVIGFHIFLYELAQSPVEDFNYATIGPGRGLFGSGDTLGPNWARAYNDLAGRAAERLIDEPAFFGRLAHVPASIYGRGAKAITPKALYPLIQMANHLAWRLLESDFADGAAGEVAVSARSEDIRDRAWRDVAAGWERLFQEISDWRGHRRADRTWAEFQRIGDNIVAHLRFTTEMTARAVWRGDALATRWTCDLLLHWRYQSQRAWDVRGSFWLLTSEGLTLSLIDRPWDDIAALPLGTHEAPPPPVQIFAAILQNGWCDHLVTMASLAIHWSLYNRVGDTGTLAARMLLLDQPLDAGDVGHRGALPLSGVDVLVSILRIRGGGSRFDDSSYAGRFDHLLEELGMLGDRPWVSMRIYSSSGGLSFDALPLAQVLAIMATANGAQGVNGDLRRQLTQADDQALQRRLACLDALIEALGAVDFDHHHALLAAVCNLDAVSFMDRLAHARRLLEEARAVLTERRAAAIAEAEIDPARIQEVRLAASADAFSEARFPFNLFQTIESTPDELAPFTLRADGLSKGSFTNPLMGQTVINEDDWWREVIAQRTAGIVWADVLRAANLQDLEARTAEEFWRAVRDGSARIRAQGHDPVMVLANSAQPDWLGHWRWPYGPDRIEKPEDLVITEAPNQAEGYAFTMNETPVYEELSSIYGQACLIPSQMLARVRYHDYGAGVPLHLEFQPNPDDPWTGSMAATFQRAVDLAPLDGFRIHFSAP